MDRDVQNTVSCVIMR